MKDEQIKSYFLGELEPTAAENLEERLATDETTFEQAQIVESELLDDYLRENLSISERRQLENNYLTTKTRRAKLRSAIIFWKIAGESSKLPQASAAPARISFWQSFFASPARLAAVGLLFAVLLGGFLLLWLDSKNKHEIAREQNFNQTPAPSLETKNTAPPEIKNNANPAVENSIVERPAVNLQSQKHIAPKPDTKTAPLPKETGRPQTLAFFALAPGLLRDGNEQNVKINSSIKTVKLRLNLPADAGKYQNYNAVLRDAEGETIFISPNLKSLNLTLPADKLENRTYIIFLEGQNPPNIAEPLTEYTFQVHR